MDQVPTKARKALVAIVTTLLGVIATVTTAIQNGSSTVIVILGIATVALTGILTWAVPNPPKDPAG